MQITIKTLTGKNIQFIVDDNQTVDSLKQKFQSKQGVPKDQQRFVFSGQLMDDGELLTDYKIEQGSVIINIMRLRS